MKLAVAQPGSMDTVKTGEWRAFKPVLNQAKCVKCGICQNFCPEGIMGKVGEFPDIDYNYCKGCSTCAIECPFKAIEMARDKK
jgi:2-oxoacid:acceptor oxidoreductase delta subunit (pyruvate/2-ketoisovalerate family)